MKKALMILLIIIIIITISLISNILIQNKKTLQEIKRLEKIIELREEINLEYSYLLERTENVDINKQIKENKETLLEQKNIMEILQEEIIRLKEENNIIQEQIEIKQEQVNKKLEEKRQKEIELEKQSTIKIEREITYSQFPEYPTGCESIALYILLKYYDIDVTPDEIINNLKKGPLPYQIEDKMYGGNPELEFIGDPRNDYSYGVFNTPIAEVASTFKGNVQNKEGLELEQILEIVSQNRPVIVWTTLGNANSRISSIWIYRQTGEKIYWKENEHAVVIIGYSNNSVIVSDPYTGRIEKYNRSKFKENYNYMGKRAVYY